MIASNATRARLELACRIAEKAHRAGQTVLLWDEDAAELAALDELLWTFADRSFVPHERVAPGSDSEAPVLLTAGPAPQRAIEVLINLSSGIPEAAAHAARVIEIVDSDPARRAAGRARFKAYRERGIEPASHQLAAASQASGRL